MTYIFALGESGHTFFEDADCTFFLAVVQRRSSKSQFFRGAFANANTANTFEFFMVLPSALNLLKEFKPLHCDPYPLVICHIAMENHVFSCKIHYK